MGCCVDGAGLLFFQYNYLNFQRQNQNKTNGKSMDVEDQFSSLRTMAFHGRGDWRRGKLTQSAAVLLQTSLQFSLDQSYPAAFHPAALHPAADLDESVSKIGVTIYLQ